MVWLIWIPLGLLFYTFFCWVWYLGVMQLATHRERLQGTMRVLGYTALYIGLVLDFFLNVVVGSILFADIPRETAMTARLKRMHEAGGWRATISFWICNNMLNPFAPGGKHC